jgi:hypothetical protein
MTADAILGIVTILMGAAGIVVSLYPPSQKWQKALHATVFGILCMVGFVCVLKQSKENAVAGEQLKTALHDLQKSSSSIKDVTTLNTDLQKQLIAQGKVIVGLSKENIADVTGGDSYCFVVATPTDIGEFRFYASVVGSSPLHNIFTEMVDRDVAKTFFAQKTLSFNDIPRFTTYFPELPFLSVSTAQGGPSARLVGAVPIGSGERRNLSFNFSAINGMWHQDLILQHVNGQWLQASRVKDIDGVHIRRTDVPDNFPRVNGQVDW